MMKKKLFNKDNFSCNFDIRYVRAEEFYREELDLDLKIFSLNLLIY